ncbi:MAG: hypothetical protein IKK58_02585 [Clostridia bacterium]|nr:hypothetical protein [Clostridia bacterium]
MKRLFIILFLISFLCACAPNTVSPTLSASTSDAISVSPSPAPTVSLKDNLPFDEPLELSFNYCPSIMELEDGTRYVYYCATKESGVVQDHIYCRKGTPTPNGYIWGEKTLVLAPTDGTFDGLHCCDPSVIKGDFCYNGEKYQYLMAYTGNTYHVNNKVGLALSNHPTEGFVSIGEPFIINDGDESFWGVGQPSLLSVDKKGTVMLFYSYGGLETCTFAEKWDLSDLDDPKMLSRVKLTSSGIKGHDGSADVINNIDVAFDPSTSRYYMVRDCHPNPTDGEPSFVASHFNLSYLPENGDASAAFADQATHDALEWVSVVSVGPDQTGFVRNSNCGIVRDEFGAVKNSHRLDILYSMSELGTDEEYYAWSYRIHSYSIELK